MLKILGDCVSPYSPDTQPITKTQNDSPTAPFVYTIAPQCVTFCYLDLSFNPILISAGLFTYSWSFHLILIPDPDLDPNPILILNLILISILIPIPILSSSPSSPVYVILSCRSVMSSCHVIVSYVFLQSKYDTHWIISM